MPMKMKTKLFKLSTNTVIGFIGGFLAIYLLLSMTEWTNHLWIMAPFGASCVLAFGVSDSPLAQPRNIIGGHFIASMVGIIFKNYVGDTKISIAIAVGLSIALMLTTKTTHPPAGADPLVVLLTTEVIGWKFLLFPVLSGALIIVILAFILNNVPKERKYPTFWI
ncbi:HPP family protein [Enterococcus faecalis]